MCICSGGGKERDGVSLGGKTAEMDNID